MWWFCLTFIQEDDFCRKLWNYLQVKEPVLCPNYHVFCSQCMEVWMQRNKQCPACRIDINPGNPLKKIIGRIHNQHAINHILIYINTYRSIPIIPFVCQTKQSFVLAFLFFWLENLHHWSFPFKVNIQKFINDHFSYLSI